MFHAVEKRYSRMMTFDVRMRVTTDQSTREIGTLIICTHRHLSRYVARDIGLSL